MVKWLILELFVSKCLGQEHLLNMCLLTKQSCVFA